MSVTQSTSTAQILQRWDWQTVRNNIDDSIPRRPSQVQPPSIKQQIAALEDDSDDDENSPSTTALPLVAVPNSNTIRSHLKVAEEGTEEEIETTDEYGMPLPPFPLHESMLDKLDEEYLAYYNTYLIDHAFMINTHLYPPPLLRLGGRLVPGPRGLTRTGRTEDIMIRARPDHDQDGQEAKQGKRETQGQKEGEEKEMRKIPCRVWWPASKKPEAGYPVFVWAHGGGWILGGIGTENAYTSRVCQLADCVVISVGYRLAPEHPFPACLHDFWDCLMWTLTEGPATLGIDRTRVAIGGSSAGGNIAAVSAHEYAALQLIDQKLPDLKIQLLLVPVTDNSASPETHPSWSRNEFSPQLPAAKMLTYRNHYLPSSSDWTNPRASPIFFSDESFKRVSKAFIAAAEADVLCSENEIYGAKIREVGGDCVTRVYEGVPHHVMGLDGVLSMGRTLVSETAEALRVALHCYEVC